MLSLFENSETYGLDEVTVKSICAPFDQLMENASSVWESKAKYPIGYDVKNFCEVNMFDAGIVDSTKAIKHALINAVSASNTMLMTDNVLTNARLIQNRN